MFLWQYWLCSRLIKDAENKDAEKYPMIFQHSSWSPDLWDRAAHPLFSESTRRVFVMMAPKSWPLQWGTFFPNQFRMDKALDKVLKVFWSHSILILESTNLASAETRQVKPLRQHCADDDGRTCRARSSTWSRLPAAWHGWFRSHCDHIWHLLPPGWNFS